MDPRLTPNSGRWLIYRYILALDTGNLDEIEMVLQSAQDDPELERIIAEVNQAYAEELGVTPLEQDVANVRPIIEEIFTRYEDISILPLTIGDVASRLATDQSATKQEREIGQALRNSQVELPKSLSLQAVRQLAANLPVRASERFLRTFRDFALQMMMGQGQAQMAATRRKRTQRSRTRSKSPKQEE